MFACVVAAVGGILISSIGGISYGLVETGLQSFSVVILGGLDSFVGAMVAGPHHRPGPEPGGRLPDTLYLGGIKDIIPFVIIIIVVLFKPYGLFGEKRIERI